MVRPSIPDDLHQYLRDNPNARLQLGEGEIQELTLFSLEELATKAFDVDTCDYYLNGELEEDLELSYEFEGVDLVKNCDAYDPLGILIWFPALGAYGSWDCDHHTIMIYPGKSWSEIMQAPTWYFNGQWNPENVAHEHLKPWTMRPEMQKTFVTKPSPGQIQS